jgi:hypothetical protein
MKPRLHLGRDFSFTTSLLVLVMIVTVLSKQSTTEAAKAQPDQGVPSPGEKITGETLLAKVAEQDRLRDVCLQSYSVTRTYLVKNGEGKLRAEALVWLQYQAPGGKEFKILSETGSQVIRKLLKSLLDMEVETSVGRGKDGSSITRANYTFEIEGEDDIDGYHCFVVQATPKRKDKCLFEGSIWINALDFAITKIAGQPAKSPSFWIKRADFVRRYQKIGECWLPRKDETVSQVRLFGRNTLTIEHNDYHVSLRGGLVQTNLERFSSGFDFHHAFDP